MDFYGMLSTTSSGTMLSENTSGVSYTETSTFFQTIGATRCGLLYDFISGFVVIGTVCLFGFVGNILSVLVMWPERKTSPTSFLLLVLAIVDILVLVTRFTMRSLLPFCEYTNACSGLEKNIHLNTFGYTIAQGPHMATAWVTVLVTFHRYVVVCLPQSRNRLASLKMVRVLVSAVLCVTFFYTLPRYFEVGIVQVPNSTELIGVRRDFAKTASYRVGYRLVSYYFIMYVIPLIILITLSYKLGRTVIKAEAKRHQLTNKAQDRQDVTKTLVVIVIVFVVCQLPAPIRRILYSALPDDDLKCPHFSFFVGSISNFLICLNSATNFILYCVFGRRFRRRLYSLVCLRSKVGPQMSNLYTTQSQHANSLGPTNPHATTSASSAMF